MLLSLGSLWVKDRLVAPLYRSLPQHSESRCEQSAAVSALNLCVLRGAVDGEHFCRSFIFFGVGSVIC